jgi:hypothetical protein
MPILIIIIAFFAFRYINETSKELPSKNPVFDPPPHKNATVTGALSLEQSFPDLRVRTGRTTWNGKDMSNNSKSIHTHYFYINNRLMWYIKAKGGEVITIDNFNSSILDETQLNAIFAQFNGGESMDNIDGYTFDLQGVLIYFVNSFIFETIDEVRVKSNFQYGAAKARTVSRLVEKQTIAASVGDVIEGVYFDTSRWLVMDGNPINVEDEPLLWMRFYLGYRGDVFEIDDVANSWQYAGNDADYAAVTGIDLNNQSLTTYFNFLDNFDNLQSLTLGNNPLITLLDNFDKSKLIYLGLNFCSLVSINIDNPNLLEEVYMLDVPIGNIDFTQKIKLRICNFQNTNATNADLSNCTLLEEVNYAGNDLEYINIDNLLNLSFLKLQGNLLSDLNISNNELLIELRVHSNLLNNLANSQLLIDLDSHGKTNGYFQSSIFGGGTLTPEAIDSIDNLTMNKDWTVII